MKSFKEFESEWIMLKKHSEWNILEMKIFWEINFKLWSIKIGNKFMQFTHTKINYFIVSINYKSIKVRQRFLKILTSIYIQPV